MVGQYLVQSKVLNEQLDIHVIPIHMSADIEGLGRFDFSKILAAFNIYAQLLRHFLTRRTDAVYISVAIDGFAVWRDLFSVLLCRFFGKRRILHLHMRGIKERYETSPKFRLIYRMMFSGAFVVHLSEGLYEDVSPVVPHDHFFVLSNGVPDPVAGASVGDVGDAFVPVLLYVSNLLREKGALDLLAASLQLRAEGIAHRVVFIGAPQDQSVVDALKAAASQFEDGSIRVLGGVYGSDKERLFLEADIFVFPSYYRYECQPLSLIEAMAHGLPVIATRIAAIPDMVRDGVEGVLVEPHSVHDIVQAVRMFLLDDDMRIATSRAARLRYLTSYSLETFEKNAAELFSMLAKR